MIRRKKYFLFGFVFVPGFLIAFIFLWAATHGSSFAAAMIRAWTQARILTSVSAPNATVFLPVKFDKQDRALSCEAAGLKMALAYRGVQVDERQLLEEIGVEPVARRVMHAAGGKGGVGGSMTAGGAAGVGGASSSADGRGGVQIIWGDPQKGFVGNVDGKMFQDGYGVHWDPIARVAKKYRPAYAITNYDIPALVYELDHGNPVIAWAYLGSGKPTSWMTPEGELVKSVYYEHIFVVNGYSGPKDAPTGFHVIDTLYGPRFYSTAEFLKRWNAFGRSGVVVL